MPRRSATRASRKHGASDFDRAARQQRLLLSMREQADPQELIPPPARAREALKKSIKTDIPLDQIDALLGLASEVDTENIRSYVFSPPLYQQEVRHGLLDGPVHRPHPGRGQEGVQHGARGRGAAPEAGRRGGHRSGCSTARARRTAARGSRAISSTRGWPPPRRAQQARGRGPGHDRRSSSTTAPRPR